jgi:TonB family protein
MTAARRLAALLLMAAALPLAAQTAPAAIQLNPRATLPVTPEERKNIEELLRASGAVEAGKRMARQFAGQVGATLRASRSNLPPHVASVVNEETGRAIADALDQPDGLTDMMVQLYHKYYSDEEIRQITAFYNSPVGQKTVQVTPVLVPESQNLGRAWGARLAPVILQRVQKRLTEEAANGETPPAPPRLEIAVAPRAVYPAESRAAREEGTVRLKLQVAPSGQVQSVVILKSSGYPRLDAAAIQAARAMAYKPYEAAGEAALSAEVSVAFKLGDQPRARSASKDI